ncbi:MAG TPA: hypothetical protein VFL76_04895 [Edaphocola sp.]|nr:hypothetical protein [Edaphocola sp.]
MTRQFIFSKILLGAALLSFCTANGFAQTTAQHKAYLSSGIDGYLLSTALMSKGGGDAKLTTPRFTAFLNLGVNLNYDFNNHFGAYTGLNIKNIGFIEKSGDVTIKRRDYTIGLPLGLKIGDLAYGSYVLVGGGIDFPFNYREKTFTKRSDKTKFNEWFSNRVPAAMGYVFLGAHLNPGIALKLQYYPGNFLNPDFTETTNGITYKPYAGYKVNLLVLSLGLDIPYHPKEDIKNFKKAMKAQEM